MYFRITGLPGSTAPLLWFAVLLAVVLALCLPVMPVFQVSEAREGTVIYDILSTGELVLPLRSNAYIPSKPILFHWLGSLGALASSDVTAYEIRLPSVVAGVGTVLAVMLVVHAVSGVVLATLVGAVCISQYGFLRLATDARVDMVFCMFSSLALLYWLHAYIARLAQGQTLRDVPGSVYTTVGILLGCAVLTKGPLGAVLVGAVVFGIVTILSGPRALPALFRWQLLWCAIIAVPWYVAGAVLGGRAFIERHLLFENVARLVGGTLITPKPWHYYSEHLWSQTAPWSIVLVVALVAIMRGVSGTRGVSLLRTHLSQRELLWLKSAVVWCAMTLLVLSLATGKRRAYLLTLLPAFAIVVTYCLAALQRARGALLLRPILMQRISWISLSIAVGFAVFLLVGGTLFSDALKPEKRVVLDGFFSLASVQGVPLFVAIAVMLVAGVWLQWRGAACRERAMMPLYTGLGSWWLMFAAMSFIIFSGLTAKGYGRSYASFAHAVSQEVAPGDVLLVPKMPYDESIDGFLFYYRKPLQILDGTVAELAPGTYLARPRWLAYRIPNWREDLTIRMRGGRRVDASHEELVLFELTSTRQLAPVPTPETLLAPAW